MKELTRPPYFLCLALLFSLNSEAAMIAMVGLEPRDFLKCSQHLTDVVRPPAETFGFIPTLNRQGYQTSGLDRFSQAFVDRASRTEGIALEVGAAYGVATLEALRKGAYIIANDADDGHLRLLTQEAPEVMWDRLRLIPGFFPEAFKTYAIDNFFSEILIARVLHFFDGNSLIHTVNTAHRWLKQGGRLTVVVETPYLKNWSNFIPDYKARVRAGEPWPGYVEVKKYAPERAEQLPEYMHFMDPTVLERVFRDAGFEVEEVSFLNRTDFPENMRYDGRESVGITGIRTR